MDYPLCIIEGMKLDNAGNIFIYTGKGINTILREFVKMPISGKALIILLITGIVYFLLKRRLQEGFASKGFSGLSHQQETFKQYEDQDIYDDFYAEMYDDLMFDNSRHAYEVNELSRDVGLTKTSRILDVGCGLGDLVHALREKKFDCMGVDSSPAMIAQALKKYPKLDTPTRSGTIENQQTAIVRTADAMNPSIVPPSSLTHVLCMNFTIYCLKDKRQFFSNAYEWLQPGGTLVVHMVNRNKFDPILPGGDPFIHVNPQHYVENRIMDTEIVFKDIKYKAKFNLIKENNEAILEERFKDRNTQKVRKHIHHLSMPTQRAMIDQAIEYGFTLKGKIDMEPCGYEHQYLYVLVKS